MLHSKWRWLFLHKSCLVRVYNTVSDVNKKERIDRKYASWSCRLHNFRIVYNIDFRCWTNSNYKRCKCKQDSRICVSDFRFAYGNFSHLELVGVTQTDFVSNDNSQCDCIYHRSSHHVTSFKALLTLKIYFTITKRRDYGRLSACSRRSPSNVNSGAI